MTQCPNSQSAGVEGLGSIFDFRLPIFFGVEGRGKVSAHQGRDEPVRATGRTVIGERRRSWCSFSPRCFPIYRKHLDENLRFGMEKSEVFILENLGKSTFFGTEIAREHDGADPRGWKSEQEGTEGTEKEWGEWFLYEIEASRIANDRDYHQQLDQGKCSDS